MSTYLADEELRDVLMRQPGNLTEQWFINYANAVIAAYLRKHGEPVADKWEGGEGWESLAWELCADEHGEEACNELVWEGGPIPEPWGDRWMKYEDEAKRLIALVHKHTAPPLTDQERQDAARYRRIRWYAVARGYMPKDWDRVLRDTRATDADFDAVVDAAMSKEPGHE